MRTQKESRQQPAKQPATNQVSEKRGQSKPEEITRWEGEGGTIVPTGNLTANAISSSRLNKR